MSTPSEPVASTSSAIPSLPTTMTTSGFAPRSIDEQLMSRTNVIRSGDSVMLLLPSKLIKMVEVKGDKMISLGKFGSFPTSALVGIPYGITYQITPPAEGSSDKPTISPLKGEGLNTVEDTMATNELIEANGDQLLTSQEIHELRKAGASAQEIIAKQIEKHPAFHLKTDYSKEKYRKRKEQKFAKTFRPLAPSVPNLLYHHTLRLPSTVLHLREDTFAHLLSFANVRPGGRYLVVDDASGIVVGGMLERMGGKGRIMTFSDTDSPAAHHVMNTQMNFPQEVIKEVVTELNWSNMEEDWELPPFYAVEPPKPDDPTMTKEENEKRALRDAGRAKKKQQVIDDLQATRDELHMGEWDGLVVASTYEPHSIVEKLSPYLAGSSNLVIYSQHLSVLTAAHCLLRAEPTWINPSITESWLRKYQVLPGRTHPFMTMSGSGGFLLTATKVYVEHDTKSILAERSGERAKAAARKRQKLEKDATASSSAALTPATRGSATPTVVASVGEAGGASAALTQESAMEVDRSI